MGEQQRRYGSGNLGHGGRAEDIPHGLPGQGRPAEIPGGEMSRISGKKDGDAGTFYAPACPGHCGHFGGGKHPPPTVFPMQHAGPLTYNERKATCYRTVHQGSVSEEAEVRGGGIEGEHGEGL